MSLSLQAARNIHLAAQGLLRRPTQPAKKETVLTTIKNLGLLQIDTIHVVARSPYLVLWSRLGNYQQTWLDEHLAEGNLFEYWSHEASFLPIENFGRYRHQMLNPIGMGWKFNQTWLSKHSKQIKQVLAHIEEFGACRSADFERTNGKAGGWWEWKPEKRSLELLFTTGKLMVAERHNFQRVYDLTERVHPNWEDKRDLGNLIDDQRDQVLDAVKALGICKSSWIPDYFRMKKLAPAIQAETLYQQGLLRKIAVDSWQEPAYYHPEHTSLIEKGLMGQLRANHTCLLSPFDPVVWDRKRALEFFDFEYRLECYTPEAKRQYGYFTLPILRRGQLIGRIDAKANRKEKVMEIKALHLEQHCKISEAVSKDIAKTLETFASWHKTPNIQIDRCDNRDLKNKLQAYFN
ncbi:winged helix-turn-helix domain-containing protein [Undibacterium fentianense]|uniref:YcaQ family DNA glycosylase n=1 Tax=Undibacterium fentianense TaxID=2828728 RepID=A0A941IF40_9BURK|nr:crosslink repair DNA glycosylase YcaQ family protein [Undibacterium fentianense]MBR7799997.1 YcaQ family DNA glycosylase [Undibacterium fentianense]